MQVWPAQSGPKLHPTAQLRENRTLAMEGGWGEIARQGVVIQIKP